MGYRIQETADMLGITPQTLRFYEQYGIRLSQRTGSGQYRSYSSPGISLLMSLKKYRTCGFTVAQTATLLTCADPAKLAAGIRAQEEQIRRDIVRQEEILRAMADIRQNLADFHMPEAPCLRLRPALRSRVILPGGQPTVTSSDVRACISRLAEQMPMCFWVAEYDHAAPIREQLPTRSFAAWAETAERLDIADLDQAAPPALCIYARMLWHTPGWPAAQAVEAVLGWMRMKDFTPKAGAMTRTIMNASCPGGMVTLGEVWVPVEEQ